MHTVDLADPPGPRPLGVVVAAGGLCRVQARCELAGSTRFHDSCRAQVHGRVLGSGLEMAAFCGHVTSTPDATFGLPELGLGLIPGAVGTVSVTRRIGGWRTAFLVLSGRTIDAGTALDWGLVLSDLCTCSSADRNGTCTNRYPERRRVTR